KPEPATLAPTKPPPASDNQQPIWGAEQSQVAFEKCARSDVVTETVPVIPTKAPLSPHSSISPDQRGKVPGRCTRDGWTGFPKWREQEATAAECEQWGKWGASGGFQGRWYPGLDIDVEDEKLAEYAERIAFKHFGSGPVRIRAGSSRRLIVYRRPED